VLVQES